MMRKFRNFFFTLALLGFVIAIITHAVSFTDVKMNMDMKIFSVLHLVVILLAFPIGFELMRVLKISFWQFVGPRALREKYKDANIFRNVPRILYNLRQIFTAYCIIIFMISIFVLKDGIPRMQNNGYVLFNNGHVTRTITEEEYYNYRTQEVRFASIFWMIFYAVEAGFFWPKRKVKRRV